MLFLSHWCDSNWCPFWAETIYSLAPMYVCSTFNEIKKCMFVQQIKNQQLLSWVLFYSVANAQQVKPDLLNLMTLGQNKWKISQTDIFSTSLAFTQSFTVLHWFHIWLVLACIEGFLQDGGIHVLQYHMDDLLTREQSQCQNPIGFVCLLTLQLPPVQSRDQNAESWSIKQISIICIPIRCRIWLTYKSCTKLIAPDVNDYGL